MNLYFTINIKYLRYSKLNELPGDKSALKNNNFSEL